jgi:hypothetical protein
MGGSFLIAEMKNAPYFSLTFSAYRLMTTFMRSGTHGRTLVRPKKYIYIHVDKLTPRYINDKISFEQLGPDP